VHAQHPGSPLEGRHRGAERGRHRALGRVRVAEDPAERALAREADQHRPAQRDERVESPHELEVLVDRLPEPHSWIEADPVLAHTARNRQLEALLEEPCDFGDDVLVVGRGLHRPRLALHVHETEVGTVLGDNLGEPGIRAQSGHVVHHLGAKLERASCDDRLRRVDRDRRPGDRLEHGLQTAKLLFSRHGLCSGTSGLRSDVDDRSTFGDESSGVLDRCVWL
jgi:hypothetical protein